MQINCTIFLQIINFLISYTLLRKIILNPLFKKIKQKELDNELLITYLKKQELDLQQLIENKKSDLKKFQEHVVSKYKKPQIILPKIHIKLISLKEDAEHNKKLIQLSKNLIVEGISNEL